LTAYDFLYTGMNIGVAGSIENHPLGVPATHPLARPDRRLALSLLLAGNGHAAASLRASHLPERTIGHVHLRFLG
jgi:hypothetical protein